MSLARVVLGLVYHLIVTITARARRAITQTVQQTQKEVKAPL